MKILAGRAHAELANRIADHLYHPLSSVELTDFPDGEFFCKMNENIRGEDVFIIQPTCPPVDKNIMELLIMLDACKRASARRIITVIPFFGYARQDRKDQPRVPITARLVANLLQVAGATRVLGMDFHSEQIQGFFDIPVDHLYAYPVVVKHLREMYGSELSSNLTIVSPDAGGFKRAYKMSRILECGLAIVSKQRKNATEVEGLNLVGDVDGRDTLLVDDMTSTAGTLCAGAEILKANGAKSVRAVVTHCLLTEVGLARLKASPITELMTTDSVPGVAGVDVKGDDFTLTRISISNLLAEAINRIYLNKSVSNLFNVE